MKTLMIAILALSLVVNTSHALNQMTLVGQYQGENSDDFFGWALTCGDFDDDGEEEFIIGAGGWNDDMGKNYFYDWNGDWPIEATWTLQGHYWGHPYDLEDSNVGDINGDGVDDFGLMEDVLLQRVDILFGGTDFDSLADWSLTAEGLVHVFGQFLDSCGDFNGDGGNDLFFYMWGIDSAEFRIYSGGTQLDTIPDWIYRLQDESDYQPCAGLGDVNGDSFGDILLLSLNDMPALVFFGGVDPDTIPDLIFSGITPGAAGGGVGDVNGDNCNDFCIGLYYPDSLAGYGYLFYGGQDVDSIGDIVLQDRFGVPGGFLGISSGDFNGDGYSDIASWDGDPYFGDVVYIYLGGPWFNPVPDALVTEWSTSSYFGQAIASGDVNGDGRDELLVGAPNWPYYYNQGRAYLFTGPDEWIDYGAVVEPEELQKFPGAFRLEQNFPNPFNSTTSIHFELGKSSTVNLAVYNLSGSKVKELISNQEMTPGGYNVSWTGKNEYDQPVASGVYLLKLQLDQYSQIKKMALVR